MDGNLLLAACFALLLGVRHGLDPDHLAMIDGMARQNFIRNPQLARRSGLWFAFGHGLVVVLVALIASALDAQWQVPAYFEDLGGWISVVMLLTLGLLNGAAVIYSRQDQPFLPQGIKTKILMRWRIAHPAAIAAVGALFALSFDTLSQAALFAISIQNGTYIWQAVLLGMLFTCGMLITDALNGWWSTNLMQHADRTAITLSRWMGGMVALLSLIVALFGILKLTMPAGGGAARQGVRRVWGFGDVNTRAYLCHRWILA